MLRLENVIFSIIDFMIPCVDADNFVCVTVILKNAKEGFGKTNRKRFFKTEKIRRITWVRY